MASLAQEFVTSDIHGARGEVEAYLSERLFTSYAPSGPPTLRWVDWMDAGHDSLNCSNWVPHQHVFAKWEAPDGQES